MKKGIRTNIDFEIRSPALKAFLFALLFVVIIFFVVYPIFVFNGTESTVRTATAVRKTVYNTIDEDAFAVREEVIMANAYKGTVVPAVPNGSKVAIGDTVANIFNSESAANNASRLLELNNEIDYYESVLMTAEGTLRTDIDHYRSAVSDALFSLSDTVENGELSEIYINSRELREAITKKQIATGYKVDVSAKITALTNEYNSLSSASVPDAVITASQSGYYVNTADGLENAVDFENIKKIDSEEVERILALKTDDVSSVNVGKLITDFNWYLVLNTSSEKLGNIRTGSVVTVTFANSSADNLNMRVAAINQTGADSPVTLVLVSNIMNEDIAALRQASIKIRVESFTGLAVDRQALRTVNGEKGVYVKVGNIAEFKKVNIIYSDEDFVLSSAPEDKKGYLELYDEIILEGVDLYDSKLIG
ncbi:MAG: hypothetical protein IJO68_00500 [Clostridia bacterium]|nr:hypothetical protein [Clostridia bacterium]